MKHRLHIAILSTLVALWSCTSVEVDPTPGKRVTFSVGSYVPQTKAVSLNSEGITSFSSKGYLYAEGIDHVQDFFVAAGETITYNPSTPEWSPSRTYYWPKSSQSYVNFVSWYDKNGQPATATQTAMSWVIDGSSRTLAPDDNIMFADVAWRYNDNATEYVATSGVSEGVPTLFHHALARVKFQAKATPVSEGTTTWSVSITNFKLEGVRKQGTLSLTNADPGSTGTRAWWTGTQGSDPAWSLSGAADTLSRAGQTFNLTVNDQPVAIMNTRSVLPQPTTDMQLSFDYAIRTDYDNSGSNYVIERLHKTIALSSFTSAAGSWEMNQSITYTITINPKSNLILFDPVCTDWVSDPNNKMYLE